ncbi:MAG: hypothetical protein CEE41_05125 [Hadesarchaea archaeon B3_Hades]|nr:MAG: hypothetical protein CEE41_05125 [Hadesarchaea archaeon B3_Hades]
MKVQYLNAVGEMELLTCNCGSVEFDSGLVDDCGTAFECQVCGENTQYCREWEFEGGVEG